MKFAGRRQTVSGNIMNLQTFELELYYRDLGRFFFLGPALDSSSSRIIYHHP